MASAAPSSVPLPEGIRPVTAHGVDALRIETGAAAAELLLDGAHLTSFIPRHGEDLLWLSPASEFGTGTAVRGGVPLVGPWFGPGRSGEMPVKHGWLRTIRWELTSAERTGDEAMLRLRTPADRRELSAELVVRIGAELALDLTITAGNTELELEAALHTYLAVRDVRGIEIRGLERAGYLDNTRGLVPDVMPDEALRLAGPTDRVVEHDGEVALVDPGARRRILTAPRGITRTVVWNPWDSGARQMADIPDPAWTDFVCVEPAVAKEGFIRLLPGASHTLGVTYRVEPWEA